ncbi:MAG: hypothetical protein J7527_14680 [Chitinophagaceae bacterium]|nr:hypothetical protein [Chitinophagaceae bacterium]
MAKGKTGGKSGSTPPSKSGGSIVLVDFRDKKDFSILYEVGQDVSHLSEERLEDLRSKGLVGTEVAEQSGDDE